MSDKSIVSPFRKSSYSGGGEGTECVEVARLAEGGCAVRDTKGRDRATQFYGAAGWNDFVAGLKEGSLRR
ncbi:hypothetical protein GCM10010329_00440 [Streptomyces spiroverticillatus]|uniref:DUF397 domain-containing protein n=1 Tax=Streptomyces finlayi TaxID=67296 RepID=A0A918WRX6_9ACTN|nr:DUF397 domain-containing protein [Streptomyces finlayi]GGZ84908.1 hypothetical protein GCM10010329_00440 [Streptomyces spiroverticillatus]GHC76644.1 hypothetical protein GCM10010334_00440 [Streptomyces finlayi]